MGAPVSINFPSLPARVRPDPPGAWWCASGPWGHTTGGRQRLRGKRKPLRQPPDPPSRRATPRCVSEAVRGEDYAGLGVGLWVGPHQFVPCGAEAVEEPRVRGPGGPLGEHRGGGPIPRTATSFENGGGASERGVGCGSVSVRRPGGQETPWQTPTGGLRVNPPPRLWVRGPPDRTITSGTQQPRVTPERARDARPRSRAGGRRNRGRRCLCIRFLSAKVGGMEIIFLKTRGERVELAPLWGRCYADRLSNPVHPLPLPPHPGAPPDPSTTWASSKARTWGPGAAKGIVA